MALVVRTEPIDARIVTLRGFRVMISTDLAKERAHGRAPLHRSRRARSCRPSNATPTGFRPTSCSSARLPRPGLSCLQDHRL